MTTGEKGEVKMLVRSQATDGEQLCCLGVRVDQRTVGVAHAGQTCYFYSAFDTETHYVMETDMLPQAFQHNYINA